MCLNVLPIKYVCALCACQVPLKASSGHLVPWGLQMIVSCLVGAGTQTQVLT